MSFRNRLTLFFVLIVVVPMLSVAFVLFRLIDDNSSGKADARLAAQQQTAVNVFRGARNEAQTVLAAVGRDPVFVQSLQDGDVARATKRAGQLVRFRSITRIALVDGQRVVFDVGDRSAIAPAIRPVRSRSGQRFGVLEVSVITAREYARRASQFAGLEVVLRRGSSTLSSTLPAIGNAPLPGRAKDVHIGGEEYRAASFAARDFDARGLTVSTLASAAPRNDDIASSRLYAGGILLGFLILAVVFAVGVSRSLQQQIFAFLEAARRLGSGDFSSDVPTTGRDEFAELGQEFNRMSHLLQTRLDELRAERERVRESMRRLGDAVASNLDRDALLQIVVRTAVEGVGADAGRVSVCDEGQQTLSERSRVGELNGLERAMERVELGALRSGAAREETDSGASAIAHPLHAADGGEGVIGVVSVGRKGRAFSHGERELFHYLAEQAAVSMENVDLHEAVTRESVTDELTGLANRRGFGDALGREIERSRRFGGNLALVMLDLDDFKVVNDTHGHQQGDVVLREVGRVVRESSREIDEPARFGGEELAIVLPGTDLSGAFNLAERVRARIAALQIPLLDGPGTIRITASFGVAALPETAGDGESLIAAADAALYEAKRAGKNTSVRAQ